MLLKTPIINIRDVSHDQSNLCRPSLTWRFLFPCIEVDITKDFQVPLSPAFCLLVEYTTMVCVFTTKKHYAKENSAIQESWVTGRGLTRSQ